MGLRQALSFPTWNGNTRSTWSPWALPTPTFQVSSNLRSEGPGDPAAALEKLLGPLGTSVWKRTEPSVRPPESLSCRRIRPCLRPAPPPAPPCSHPQGGDLSRGGGSLLSGAPRRWESSKEGAFASSPRRPQPPPAGPRSCALFLGCCTIRSLVGSLRACGQLKATGLFHINGGISSSSRSCFHPQDENRE